MDIKQLQEKADFLRSDVIRVAIKNNKGHIASSLSKVEILTALYYEIMGENDRFILSGGHSCYILYSILADKGLIPKDVWENFELTGCVTRQPEYGLLASTGSLGQGLSMACGIAYAKKLKNEPGRVYCLVGDGEMQEGQIWEALLFAKNKELDNLIIFIDDNKLQAMDFTRDIIKNTFSMLCPLTEIQSAYGHNIDDIYGLLKIRKREFTDRPLCMILETIKGKGLKCAESIPKFHYRVPSKEELNDTE